MLGTRRSALFLALAGLLVAILPVHAVAQESSAQSEPARDAEQSRTVAFAKFLAGAAVGTGLHEAGHLIAGWERYDVSRRHAIAVRSAGFWAQYVTSETVLSPHPRLRAERSPFRKGLLAFHLATSTGYAALAFTRTGPFGRDTLEMAQATRIDEPWIGALVLTPAVLDGVRYLRPEWRWAAWLSRGVKVGSVTLVLR